MEDSNFVVTEYRIFVHGKIKKFKTKKGFDNALAKLTHQPVQTFKIGFEKINFSGTV